MATVKKMAKRTKVALWLLIAPTAIIIVDLLLYSLMNWVFSTPASSPGSELFAAQTAGSVFTNSLLYILGVIGILAWLPGVIIGIVLLATPKNTKK
jgi:hypothetical protein